MQLCALRWWFFTKSSNDQSLITKISFDPGIWMPPWDWGGPYIPIGDYRVLGIFSWLNSHTKDKEPRSFRSLLHTSICVRQRALFVSLLLIHTLGNGRGIMNISQERERERPSFASLSRLHTLIWVRRRVSFISLSLLQNFIWVRQRASFVSLSILQTLRKGGGIAVRKTEGHEYLTGERRRPWFASLSLLHTFSFSRFIYSFTIFSFFNSSNMIGLCSWSPSSPGACRAVRHEGFMTGQ